MAIIPIAKVVRRRVSLFFDCYLSAFIIIIKKPTSSMNPSIYTLHLTESNRLTRRLCFLVVVAVVFSLCSSEKRTINKQNEKYTKQGEKNNNPIKKEGVLHSLTGYNATRNVVSHHEKVRHNYFSSFQERIPLVPSCNSFVRT